MRTGHELLRHAPSDRARGQCVRMCTFDGDRFERISHIIWTRGSIGFGSEWRGKHLD